MMTMMVEVVVMICFTAGSNEDFFYWEKHKKHNIERFTVYLPDSMYNMEGR